MDKRLSYWNNIVFSYKMRAQATALSEAPKEVVKKAKKYLINASCYSAGPFYYMDKPVDTTLLEPLWRLVDWGFAVPQLADYTKNCYALIPIEEGTVQAFVAAWVAEYTDFLYDFVSTYLPDKTLSKSHSWYDSMFDSPITEDVPLVLVISNRFKE